MMQEKLKLLIWKSAAYAASQEAMESFWNSCSESLYGLSDKQKQLGLDEQVCTFWYIWMLLQGLT